MRLKTAFLAFALAGAAPIALAPATAQTSTQPAWGQFGVDRAGMDTATKPGDDFWQYVNGTWARETVIPGDRGSQGQVARLGDLSSSQVRAILDEMAARRAQLRGDDLRASDFYASLMDQAAIDARGTAPLMADLAPIRAARSHGELAATMGRLIPAWIGTPILGRMPRYFPGLFPMGVGQDDREPTRYIAGMGQGGTGMARDYYLGSDEAAQRIQGAYRAHLATMLALTGVAQAEAERRAAAVYDFERKVAEAQWTVAESRDAEKNYNKWTLADLQQRAPGFDWRSYLGASGLGERPNYLVGQPTAIAKIAQLYGATPLPVLQDWLTIRLAKDRALVLPRAFGEAEFAFSGGAIAGATEAPARWMQAVELTAASMSDAVSRPYAERHFPAATKAAMEELVRNVITAMDRRLANLEWMAPETRARARAKLAAFNPMIGYPDSWRSYGGLEVNRSQAYENLVRAARFEFKRQLDRIDGPVDRNEWFMMPVTANAYASFQNNQIVFTAAYLQPPHFDINADPAVNYGAIGYVIGHEISHHFDDQGSRYDPEGRLATWWTEEDRRRFQERTARLAAQYDGYEVLPGLNIRGAQTLGENIADNAGLAVAWDAYQIHLNGREAPVIDGTSGAQRFFMGRAQVNRGVHREQALRQQVIGGVHSPPRFRAWSVRNHDAWYDAFNVRPGDRLYLPPGERVRIW